MSAGYTLVNFTRREVITFAHVDAASARELAGNEASSAITTWYLLRRAGDAVSFVSDTYNDWPFESGSKSDIQGYADVTRSVIEELLAEGILADYGFTYVDESEPETVFIRDLRNAWQK